MSIPGTETHRFSAEEHASTGNPDAQAVNTESCPVEEFLERISQPGAKDTVALPEQGTAGFSEFEENFRLICEIASPPRSRMPRECPTVSRCPPKLWVAS
jgi:hypothetical protein